MNNDKQRIGLRLAIAVVFGVAAGVMLGQGQVGSGVLFGVVAAIFVVGAVRAARGPGSGGPAGR